MYTTCKQFVRYAMKLSGAAGVSIVRPSSATQCTPVCAVSTCNITQPPRAATPFAPAFATHKSAALPVLVILCQARPAESWRGVNIGYYSSQCLLYRAKERDCDKIPRNFLSPCYRLTCLITTPSREVPQPTVGELSCVCATYRCAASSREPWRSLSARARRWR